MSLTHGADGETDVAHGLVNDRIDAAKELVDDLALEKSGHLNGQCSNPTCWLPAYLTLNGQRFCNKHLREHYENWMETNQ